MHASRNWSRRRIILWAFAVIIIIGDGTPSLVAIEQEPLPESLPAWSAGTLDVHHIATGRGNATFFVLPDGTTLLVDAGAAEAEIPYADPFPNPSRSPGEWIARYLEHFWPSSRPRSAPLDYALITHFHADHMGAASSARPRARDGEYRLSGITEVGAIRGMTTLIDRGWPDYDYPRPLTHPTFENYRRFVETHRAANGLRVQKFRAGDSDQIELLHEPAAYPEFTIRNLTANGEYWTGRANETASRVPPLASLDERDYPSENLCSLSFRLSYGSFRYYTGGDLTGEPNVGHPQWQNMEGAIGEVIGPVSVHVVNHHGSIDPATPAFLATLRPRVHIIPAWSPTHPAPSVLKRLLAERAYDGDRDVFMTAFREPTKAAIGARARRIRGEGHIVVRVAPGGDEFEIWVLDASSPTYEVKERVRGYASAPAH